MLIYRATNKDNGKSYIGQTIRSLHARRSEHLRAANTIATRTRPTIFNIALSKYGSGAFDWEILEDCSDKTTNYMNEREKFYIKLLNTIHPLGYNTTSGGTGMDDTMSEDMRNKIAAGMVKVHQDPSYRARVYPKLKGITPPNKGVPMSEAQKIKVGAARKAAYEVPGYVNPNIGQKRTEAQMENLKTGWAKRELGGEKWHEAHKDQFTPEIRTIMSQKKKGKKPVNTKLVFCNETRETFKGLTEASKALNVARQSIYLQIKGKLKLVGGKYTFKYVT